MQYAQLVLGYRDRDWSVAYYDDHDQLLRDGCTLRWRATLDFLGLATGGLELKVPAVTDHVPGARHMMEYRAPWASPKEQLSVATLPEPVCTALADRSISTVRMVGTSWQRRTRIRELPSGANIVIDAVQVFHLDYLGGLHYDCMEPNYFEAEIEATDPREHAELLAWLQERAGGLVAHSQTKYQQFRQILEAA